MFKKTNKNLKTIKWGEIKVGDKFADGSVVTQRHNTYEYEAYKLEYQTGILERKSMLLSNDHLLLCDFSKLNKEWKMWIKDRYQGQTIPIGLDVHLFIKNPKDLPEGIEYEIDRYMRTGQCDRVEEVQKVFQDILNTDEILEDEPHILENEDKEPYLCWLSVEDIHKLLQNNQKLYCNGHKLVHSYYQGIKEAFCISTDTKRYETNGLIHHNSVTLRDIIFHCLTHSNKISVAMVDLKLTEFTRYKKFKDVLAVANSVAETAELLRVARTTMYKRNKDMSDLDLQEFTDFIPQQPTDKIFLSGRVLNENDILKVRLNGEEQDMSVKDIYGYLSNF